MTRALAVILRRACIIPITGLVLSLLAAAPASAASLTFSVTASEPVIVTGTPRLAIDVGGVPREATYAAGSGTNSLNFSYTVQPGDFDANGITLSSPLDLNGGTILDAAGNAVNPLTFTVPNTSAINVQTYTTAFTTSPITEANANAVSFAIAKAPAGATFTYSISSSGGTGSVTGSGTISASTHTVSGVDVSALPSGTLTLSVTVSTPLGGMGAARTATATPSFTGVLDSLSASAAAYSVRRLRSAYTGPLLRARRASDNAAQDIGTTVAGNLDTAALASFCGASSCFATTWYDQSGNARHAAQATATSQPLIFTAGATELLGSRPGLRFDTGKLMQAANPLANADEFTIVMTAVERVRQNNWTWRLLVSTAASPRVAGNTPWGSATLIFDVQNATTGRLLRAWTYAVGTATTVSFWNSVSSNTRGVYLNGSPSLSGVGIAAASDTLILADQYSGHLSEFILFPSFVTAASRQPLERSQGSYFGTPVP